MTTQDFRRTVQPILDLLFYAPAVLIYAVLATIGVILVLSWPIVMCIKVVLWLREGIWPDFPLGMLLFRSPPLTSWIGLNEIIQFFYELDLLSWAFLFSLIGLLVTSMSWVEMKSELADWQKSTRHHIDQR